MDKIDQFIQIWLDFSLKLYERKGIDEELFDKIIQLLQDIDIEYREKDYIPKKLAEIFVDMFMAIDGCMSLYSEEIQQELYVVMHQFNDLARDICTG